MPPDDAGIGQDLVYRVEAGDAVTRDFRLTVRQAPTIAIERVEYRYPAYTKRPPRVVQRDGDLSALEGRFPAWARRKLVPKVLIANQTRVVEAVADHGDAERERFAAALLALTGRANSNDLLSTLRLRGFAAVDPQALARLGSTSGASR